MANIFTIEHGCPRRAGLAGSLAESLVGADRFKIYLQIFERGSNQRPPTSDPLLTNLQDDFSTGTGARALQDLMRYPGLGERQHSADIRGQPSAVNERRER
jgi:hypothetical protein